MSEDATICETCGDASVDPEWCDHCGAPLTGSEQAPADAEAWLDVDQTLTLEDGSEEAAIEVIVRDVVERFTNRRRLIADVVGQDRQLLLDEYLAGEEPGAPRVPEALRDYFRWRSVRGSHGDHPVIGYEHDGGMTLEDLVDITNGQLSYPQIKAVFTAILDTVLATHHEEHLVLAISPWTLSLEGGVLFPAATAAARERSEAETKPPIDEGKPKEAPQGLDSITDVYKDLDRSEATAGELSISDASEIGDFNSDWDIFEDEESEAAVATAAPPAEVSTASKDRPARAVFEGIERTFAFDGQPDEVPVILGFSAPELLGRVRADLGPGCDIFGLGMVLYYLIAGRVPPASVYTRYTPAIPVRNLRPGFPPGLQPIITRATRPAPEDRYGSVQAMRDAFLNACALMERRAEQVGGPRPPEMRLAVDTHVGINKGRRNPTNQDAVFGKTSDDGKFALIVVADGVSTASYGSGDLASHFLTAEAAKAWEEILPRYLMEEGIDEVEIISGLLDRANSSIVEHVNANHYPFSGSPHEVMGTTALVAIVHRGIVTVAALGDSRVYLQNTTGLEQITIDHNLWTLSILDGFSADSALAMPQGDALARCLGTFMIRGEKLEAVYPEPDFFRFAVNRGDSILLTTDGLIDFAGPTPAASEQNVLSVMLAEPDPALCCLELILLANRGGGGDNIGVGIAQFV